MAEPAQLVVKVQISKERYAAFLESAPPPANMALAWADWLNDKEYAGPKITTQDIADRFCRYQEKTVAEFLGGIVSNDDSGRAINTYDVKRREWTFVVLEFSENVYEYVKTAMS